MTQPTDEEIRELWAQHAPIIGGVLTFARAVLAKWGAPQQAAPAVGEPRGCEILSAGEWCPYPIDRYEEAKANGRQVRLLYPVDAAPQQAAPAEQQVASSAVLKAIREANMQLVRTGDDAFMLVPYKPATAEQQTAPEAAPAERKPLRTITYVCPVCAASLERQE